MTYPTIYPSWGGTANAGRWTVAIAPNNVYRVDTEAQALEMLRSALAISVEFNTLLRS